MDTPLSVALGIRLAGMPSSPLVYDELKTLVHTAAEREKSHKASAQLLQQVQAESEAAKQEVATLKEQIRWLHADAEKLAHLAAQTRQKDRKAAAAAEQAAQQAAAHEVQKEKERSLAEVALLRRAAMDDVRQANRAARAELDEAAKSWEAHEEAHREMARLKAMKHAARLREVILSEERCHADTLLLKRKLASQAWSTVAQALRAECAERALEARAVEAEGLADEIRDLEDELAEGEIERQRQEAEHEAAAAAAEEQLDALRQDLRAVQAKQQLWRRELRAQHEQELHARVGEAVREAVMGAQAVWKEEAAARDAEHRTEISRLNEALAASEAREAQHRAEVKAMNELLGESFG